MAGAGIPGYSSLGAPTYMLPDSAASLQSLPGLPTSTSLPGLTSLGHGHNAALGNTGVPSSIASSLPYSQFSNRFSFQNEQYSSVRIFRNYPLRRSPHALEKTQAREAVSQLVKQNDNNFLASRWID